MSEKNITDARLWELAFHRLSALDGKWNSTEALQLRKWMLASGNERLARLGALIAPEMSRERLWHVLVPVERECARRKPTDVTILNSDLPNRSALPVLDVSVVVDSLRSAMNVGGIFRTVECFGLKEIVLTGYTPDPDPAAALGTEQLVPYRRFDRALESIEDFKAKGVRCVALETVADAVTPDAFDWTTPCAVFLGSERFGLSAEIVSACDVKMTIPMFGRKNSLNVVSALAAVAYQARRTTAQ